MKSYRIAFVNPYLTAAEVQAFASLRSAAEAMGVRLEHRKPKEIGEDEDYDFLVSVAFTPKMTSHPSFLSAHSPRTVYVDNEKIFGNVASHDGYLTISENLKSFFGHLSVSYGKPLTSVGQYYNCPQTTDIQTDIAGLQVNDELALCYFGINWDMRAEPLFQALSHKSYMRIYGPPESWRTVRPNAYKGQLPFDGLSVQREYARFGVGLICLGYEHLMDDIISNRIFEISSVGAASISPDTPWMRKHFGDSVLYYEPFASIETIVEQIDQAFNAIRSDPAAAQARAAKARAIFEEHFHAEAMLRGAIAQFESWKAASVVDPALKAAEIDVVILGDDAVAASETVASLRRQSAGRFRVFAAAVGQGAPGDAVVSVESSKAVGEGEAGELAAAMARMRAPHVVVARAGDRFLSHHFERMLRAAGGVGAALAYSDTLTHKGGEGLEIDLQGEPAGSIDAVLDRLPVACLLMPRMAVANLGPRLRGLGVAAERVLVATALARSEPMRCPGPSCITARPAQTSRDVSLEERLAMRIELSQIQANIEAKFASPVSCVSERIGQAVVDLVEETLDQIAPERIFEGGMVGRDVTERPDIVHVSVPLKPERLAAIVPIEQAEGGVVRFRPAAPFDIAVRIDIADYVLPGTRPSAIFALESASDTIFLGMVDAAGEIVARTITPKSRRPLKVWVNTLIGPPPAEAIIQAWSRVPGEPIGLTGLTLAYKASEIAASVGQESIPLEAAQEVVRRWLNAETVGEPPVDGGQPTTIDLHSPRSQYRSLIEVAEIPEGSPEPVSPAGRGIRTGAVPWDYFAQMFVPAQPDARTLKIELSHIEEPCTAFLVNTAFDREIGSRFEVRGGKETATVWIPLPAEPQDLYLVLQAQDPVYDTSITVRRLSAL